MFVLINIFTAKKFRSLLPEIIKKPSYKYCVTQVLLYNKKSNYKITSKKKTRLILKTGIKMSSNTESLKTLCRNRLITQKNYWAISKTTLEQFITPIKEICKTENLRSKSHKILILADLAFYPDDPGCMIQSLKPFFTRFIAKSLSCLRISLNVHWQFFGKKKICCSTTL